MFLFVLALPGISHQQRPFSGHQQLQLHRPHWQLHRVSCVVLLFVCAISNNFVVYIKLLCICSTPVSRDEGVFSCSLSLHVRCLQFVFNVVYVFFSSWPKVYCPSVTNHNKLWTVMRRFYFLTALDNVFCLAVGAINRPKPRFNRHAWLEWD